MPHSSRAQASTPHGACGRGLAGMLALAAVTCTAVAILCSAASGRTSGGTNLLLNSAGGVGATSAQGWDSVTIPGWQVREGLPTVVSHGTRGFPRAGAAAKRLFAGGPGGPALLAQQVSLLPPDGTPMTRRTHYRLSAWLGGTATSAASLRAVFRSAGGRTLAAVTVGPVGEKGRRGWRSDPPLESSRTEPSLRRSFCGWPRRCGTSMVPMHRASVTTEPSPAACASRYPRRWRVRCSSHPSSVSHASTTCSCSCSRIRTSER